MKMHSISFTITVHGTISAYSILCPLTVTKRFISALPYIPKIILIYISLIEFVSDARTRGYTTICKDRCYLYSCIATIEIVCYLPFIFAYETFTTITHTDFTFITTCFNKFHDFSEIIIAQLEFRVLCCTTNWEYSEQSPMPYS